MQEPIGRMQLQIERLHRGMAARGGERAEVDDALEELAAALDEVRAREAELRTRHDALAVERERYRALFDAAPDGYLITDLQGVIREANRAAGKLLGVQAERLAGLSIAVFVPGAQRRRFRLELGRRQLEAHPREWALELHPRRGEPVPVECTLAVIRDGGEATLRWLVRDVRERRRAAEEALGAREATAAREAMAGILERITDGFVALDRRWRFTYVNGAAERMLGVAREDLLDKELLRVVPEMAGSTLHDLLERAMSGQTPVSLEDYVPLLGRWFSIHAYPSLAGVSVYFEDINERHAAEEERDRIAGELMAERAILDQILQQLPVGVIIAEAPSGRILVGNRFVQRIWGGHFPLAASLDGYTRAYRAFHPDGRPYEADEWPLARAIRGEVVRDEEVHCLVGEEVRRTLAVSAAPIRDSRGRILAGVASLQDVTATREEEARDRFLARVSDVINQSLDYRQTVQSIARTCAGTIADYCVLHVEEEGEIRAVGVAHADPVREEIVRALARRLPIEGRTSHPIYQAIHTGKARLLPRIDDALLLDLAADAEHLELMRDLGLASAVIVPLKARGRILGTLSLARGGDAPEYGEADLALVEEVASRSALAVDNARLYREARRAAKARRDLLGVVSHDLRNALHAAVMHGELLRLAAPAGDERQERLFGSLRRSLEHMQRLVEDLLEVDSLETGRLSLQTAPVQVAAVLEEVRDVFGERARARSVELVWEVAADLPPVQADRVRVVQILSNLLENALQHTPAGGTVRVRVKREGGALRFSVRDSGPGVEPQHAPRVFERFWRGSGSSYPGSGLGLTISRGLVRAHGGEIGVESAPGEGATFWFTIPVSRAA